MSTKIYNGYKMRNLSTKELFEFTQELKELTYDYFLDKYIILFQEYCETMVDSLMYADYEKDYEKLEKLLLFYYKEYMYDARSLIERKERESSLKDITIEDVKKRFLNTYPILARAVKESIRNSNSIAETNHTIMNDEYYFKADIVVFPIFRGYSLFMTYSDNFTSLMDTIISSTDNEKYKAFASKYQIKDYHYQNQTDKPDNISKYCWNKRDFDWNCCLKNGVPSLNGICIDIMASDMFDVKQICARKNMPEYKFAPKTERVKKLAKSKVLDEYFYECKNNADSNRSDFGIYSDTVKLFKETLKDENSELSIRVKKKEKELEKVIIDIDKEVLIKDIAFFIPNYCDHIKRGVLNKEI